MYYPVDCPMIWTEQNGYFLLLGILTFPLYIVAFFFFKNRNKSSRPLTGTISLHISCSSCPRRRQMREDVKAILISELRYHLIPPGKDRWLKSEWAPASWAAIAQRGLCSVDQKNSWQLAICYTKDLCHVFSFPAMTQPESLQTLVFICVPFWWNKIPLSNWF